MSNILSNKIINLLNFRIEKEEESSRIYKAMSLWFEYNGYTGAAKLWSKYSNEELTHAEWSYRYLIDLDILPEVPTLKAQKTDFKSFVDVVEKSYEHEIDILNQCNKLAKESLNEDDFMTHELALKYVKEQREEIAKIKGWLDRIENQGGYDISRESVYLLDNEMANV